MGFELEEPRSHEYRKHFGRVARILAVIGYVVLLLSMVTFGLTISLGIMAIVDSSFESFMFSLFLIIGIPIIKLMAGIFCGMYGMALLGTYRYRKWAAGLLLVAGIVSLLPIGEPVSTALIIESFGWWLFLPYFIGGGIFISAAIFAALWASEMRLPRSAEYPKPVIEIESPKARELYVCPNCRTPLLGDERYCPGCAKRLRKD
jgi:hypothetical protein